MILLLVNFEIIPNLRLIGHITYTTPWIHFPRTSDEYILYIVKSGELFIQENGLKYELKKNDMLLLEPNIQHSGFKESCCSYYYIHFKHSDITRVLDKYVEDIKVELIKNRMLSLKSDYFSEKVPSSPSAYLPKCYHFENPSEIFEILNVTEDDFFSRYENYKSFASWKLSEILLKICRDYISNKVVSSQVQFSKTYTKAVSIINYLNINYSKKISSSDIEKNFESNYDYLNRIFQKITGHTIFNYLNIVRITSAKELIITTPLKFSEIAYLVGIDDQYYFSKLFKKIVGITPTQYFNNNCKL
jgi:YesN/AraC family two-component response regulator